MEISNVFLIEPERCDGCRDCEKECKLAHAKRIEEDLSLIRIIEDKHWKRFLPVLCVHCDEAPCAKVCPMNARVRQESGAMITDKERCIGCRACLYICPFGAPRINEETKKSETCDLCLNAGGEPRCVKACGNKRAIVFVPTSRVKEVRGKVAVDTIKKVLQPKRAIR